MNKLDKFLQYLLISLNGGLSGFYLYFVLITSEYRYIFIPLFLHAICNGSFIVRVKEMRR